MSRISESIIIGSLPLDITSATTYYAPAVSMDGAQTAAFIVSMGPCGAGNGLTITAQQAINTTKAESSNAAAITGATAALGSTIANYVYKASRARIAVSSATTDNQTVVLNGTTLTNATAVSATALIFGSTAGATGAGGIAEIVASLSSMVNNNFKNLSATTGTSWVDIRVKDSASTSITLLTTGGGLTPSYLSAQTVLEVMTPGLDATSLYVSVAISSIASACAGSVVTLRNAYIGPARAHGVIVNDKNT